MIITTFAGAAVVVLVVGGAFFIVQRGQPGIGGLSATASPSASPSQAAVASPSATPMPFVVPGGRAWTVTVNNESSDPTTLFVTEEDETGMGRQCGTVTPSVVPPETTMTVTFLLPPKSVTNCWIWVNPAPGEGGSFFQTSDAPLNGGFHIDEGGQVMWGGAPYPARPLTTRVAEGSLPRSPIDPEDGNETIVSPDGIADRSHGRGCISPGDRLQRGPEVASGTPGSTTRASTIPLPSAAASLPDASTSSSASSAVLAWSRASLDEDWPAPVRAEPAGGPKVVPILWTDNEETGRYEDPTGDTESDAFPWVDIHAVSFCHNRACPVVWVPGAPNTDPTEQWIAYGLVVDDDGDGVADRRFGIDNIPGPTQDWQRHRAWITDLHTGQTERRS